MNFANIWNKVKKTTTFCSTNGYCPILLTFRAIWRQNFYNFIPGHTVQRDLPSTISTTKGGYNAHYRLNQNEFKESQQLYPYNSLNW